MSWAFLIFLAASAAAATWVSFDYRARVDGSRWERAAWWLGTLVALPIFLPIYLVAARPLGRLVRCPSCGRPTLVHRAACRHCGNPIAFEPPPKVWGLGEVIGISVVFMLALPVIAAAIGVEGSPTLGILSAFAIAQNAMFIGLTAYVVRERYRLPLDHLGLRTQRWPVWVIGGAIVGALTIPLSVVAERAAVIVIGAFLGRPEAEAMAEREHLEDVLTGILQGPLTGAEVAWIIILVCLIVPLAEEMFFRGFVYGALRRWGLPTATVLSALFFAAVHQQPVHFFPIFLLGVVLAVLYERTGSLLPSIAVHAINNAVAIVGVLYNWNI